VPERQSVRAGRRSPKAWGHRRAGRPWQPGLELLAERLRRLGGRCELGLLRGADLPDPLRLLGRCRQLPGHLFDVLTALLEVLIEQFEILLGGLGKRGGGGVGLQLGLCGLRGGRLFGDLLGVRGGGLLGIARLRVGHLRDRLFSRCPGRLGGRLRPIERGERLGTDRRERLVAFAIEQILVALGQPQRLRRLAEGFVERRELGRRRRLVVGHEDRDPERTRLGPLPLRVADGEDPDPVRSRRQTEPIGGDRRLDDDLRVGRADDERQLVEHLRGTERRLVAPHAEGDLVDPPVVEEVRRHRELVERRELNQLRLRLLDDQRRRPVEGGEDLHGGLRPAAMPLGIGKLEAGKPRLGASGRPGALRRGEICSGDRQRREPA
jgi:hypothetical protein